jgi:hypothetical protein
MSNAEKWACWTLGVVAMTVAAYAAFLAFLGHRSATLSVFALLALTALPAFSRRHFLGRTFDEREREIANKAHRAGFSAFWLAFIGLFLATWFIKGWGSTLTVPVWMLAEAVWLAATFVLGVQAITTIVLYRGGPHA